jgi:membrane protein DedA with SNARE-associated domain
VIHGVLVNGCYLVFLIITYRLFIIFCVPRLLLGFFFLSFWNTPSEMYMHTFAILFSIIYVCVCVYVCIYIYIYCMETDQ